MKWVTTVLTLIITISIYGQDFSFFKRDNSFNWKKWESSEITTKIIKNNFEEIKGNSDNNLEFYISNINKFHLIDIDNDNINELIYNGYSGGEGEIIVIYKFENNKFIKKEFYHGKICDIMRNKNNDLTFIVNDYSCCGGYVDHLETFIYDNKEKTFKIIKSIAINTETKIPEKFIKPIRFKINNTPYNLRFSPEILTKEGEYDFKPINNQNIIGVYKKGDTGAAYSEKIDKTGRKWWFVIMD